MKKTIQDNQAIGWTMVHRRTLNTCFFNYSKMAQILISNIPIHLMLNYILYYFLYKDLAEGEGGWDSNATLFPLVINLETNGENGM